MKDKISFIFYPPFDRHGIFIHKIVKLCNEIFAYVILTYELFLRVWVSVRTYAIHIFPIFLFCSCDDIDIFTSNLSRLFHRDKSTNKFAVYVLSSTLPAKRKNFFLSQHKLNIVKRTCLSNFSFWPTVYLRLQIAIYVCTYVSWMWTETRIVSRPFLMPN